MINDQERARQEAMDRLVRCAGHQAAGVLWAIGLKMARAHRARNAEEFILRVFVPAVERARTEGRLQALLRRWERPSPWPWLEIDEGME